jgi:hypothetical protein
MARRTHHETEVAGSDSFLDVTTNIVGILIILVMVVGERAKTAPIAVEPAGPSRQVIEAETEADNLASEVRRLTAQMATIDQELNSRHAQRDELSTLVTAIERDLADQRATLDAQSRGRYDLDRELAIARDELSRLDDQRRDAEQAAQPQTVEIENFPTPIGKTVDDKEAHFQLRHGRLAVVPYEPLVARLRNTLREQLSRLSDQPELIDTLGPVEGFRLRYVIQRNDTPAGSLFQVTYIEFIPISSQLGEPVDEALAAGSAFRRSLQSLSPHQYTITVWTYPDSFAEFARLKKALYGLGYSVAARPLPEGMLIGASPYGTKSSAE